MTDARCIVECDDPQENLSAPPTGAMGHAKSEANDVQYVFIPTLYL